MSLYRYDVQITYTNENIVRGLVEVFEFPDNRYAGSFKIDYVGGHLTTTPYREDVTFHYSPDLVDILNTYLAGVIGKKEISFWRTSNV